MTLDRAVEILNERKHQDCKWTKEGIYDDGSESQEPCEFIVEGLERSCLLRRLSEFEAIAVAEKYEREKI